MYFKGIYRELTELHTTTPQRSSFDAAHQPSKGTTGSSSLLVSKTSPSSRGHLARRERFLPAPAPAARSVTGSFTFIFSISCYGKASPQLTCFRSKRQQPKHDLSVSSATGQPGRGFLQKQEAAVASCHDDVLSHRHSGPTNTG